MFGAAEVARFTSESAQVQGNFSCEERSKKGSKPVTWVPEAARLVASALPILPSPMMEVLAGAGGSSAPGGCGFRCSVGCGFADAVAKNRCWCPKDEHTFLTARPVWKAAESVGSRREEDMLMIDLLMAAV